MIVTHSNPDFDCILATWFLKRFCGESDSDIHFVKFGQSIPQKFKDAIVVDIGKGKFDHHQRNDYVSAAYLVLLHYKLDYDPTLKKLADISRKVDHGLTVEEANCYLNLLKIISGLNKKYPDNPDKVLTISQECLDAIYEQESSSSLFKEIFEKAAKFNTKWGLGIGVTTNKREVRKYCHDKGYNVFIYVDPQTKYRGIAAPGGKGIDFSPLFEKVKKLEPDTEWYLHFTKDLLICGSDKALNKELSKLRLKDLIELAKSEK